MAAMVVTWLLALWALLGCGPAAVETAPPAGLAVTDASGRTLTLEQAPRRIAVAGHGTYIALHTLFLFEEGRRRLVAVEQRGHAVSEFLPLVEPGFPGERAIRGMGAGPEHVAAAAPDLVLAKYSADTRLADSLAEVGIPVVYLDLEGPERFERDVGTLGRLLESEDRAAEILAWYRARRDRVADAVARAGSRPRVLLLAWRDRGGTVAFKVPARTWVQTVQVELGGGDPVWLDVAEHTSGWTIVNLEQVAAWNPERIFMVVPSAEEGRQILARAQADPIWSRLDAVRAGELLAFPVDLYGWDAPDPRWILGLLWTARTLHPDLLADLDLQAEVLSFYGELYGLDEAVVRARILPLLSLDGR